MKIRTLIVDDEPPARERLRQLLRDEPRVELLGECANGREAVDAIRAQHPDLVLLDIQMPGLNGFGVLEELGAATPPAVIFVTAYDRFALQAFEVHAVDYLLKPFDRERFQTALRRAITRLEQRDAGDLNQRIRDLLADLKPGSAPVQRLAVRSTGRVVFVKVEDIDWVESADNYVNLHVGHEAYLHRETMNALEQSLPAQTFMRISRSTIVNVDRIKELQPMFHGDYTVILRNGVRLTLSRGYRDKLQALIGKAG